MDTYKWITNISTPYAYQIGTIRKIEEAKKTNLCQNISKWSYYMYKCVSFYILLLIYVIKIVFFDMVTFFVINLLKNVI